jgi:predicted RNA-binding Zn ribbon-like protein
MAHSEQRIWVLPDEPQPVRLMSTIWADTAGVHDDLLVPSDLDAWLDAIGVRGAGERATKSQLAQALELRDAVRRLAAEVTHDTRDAAVSPTTEIDEAVAAVNGSIAQLPTPRLEINNGQLERNSGDGDSPISAALAHVAEQSSQLLTGEPATTLRACYAPGCVLYFVKSHPRREWCSIACGNRARAARHYDKIRKSEPRGHDNPAHL